MSKACALDYAEELRRSLDRDKSGWTRELVRCPLHGGYHELTPADGRMFSMASDDQVSDSGGRLTTRFRLLEGGLRCFHPDSASGQALPGPCAYCGTVLHVHKDALGRVKSGAHQAGFLEERCPACHRANAVFPAYGHGSIRVAQLAEGVPTLQMKLS